MIERSRDPSRVTEFVAGGGGPLVADERNICLVDEDGAGLFIWHGPGVYEGHSAFRARGRAAIDLGKAMLAEMFDHYAARLIWGATPLEKRNARWFSRQIGFSSAGHMEMPVYGPCELFVLEKR